MPRRKQDLFARVRRQAEKALALLNVEIRRTEAELRRLLAQAQLWRDAIAGAVASGVRGAIPGRRGRGVAAAGRGVGGGRRRGAAKRVNWDEVLRSVPEKFRVDDILKHSGARAKGRAQIYPALTRWLEAKKIKKIAQGHYQRL